MAKISVDDAKKKWGFVNKLEYLLGFLYNKKDHSLSVPNSIDTIPAGLKGVDIVYVHRYHFPEFIAPDFKGRIKCNLGNIEMPKEWIEDAQKNYQENEKIARALRYNRFMDSWAVLPENMCFFEDEKGRVCLDLTQTDIKYINRVIIDGVDQFITKPVQMELDLIFPKKIASHKGCQMVHHPPKTYGR